MEGDTRFPPVYEKQKKCLGFSRRESERDGQHDRRNGQRTFFFSVGLSPLTSGSGRLRKRTSGATRDFRLLVLSWGTLATACEGLWLSGRKVCVGGRG